MQIKLYLTLFVGLFSQLLGAQNLVTNPGFENLTQCPYAQTSYTITFASGWMIPSSNLSGTPDLFNECSTTPFLESPSNTFGYQYPYEGETYAGIIVYAWDSSPAAQNMREYICTELKCSLKAGKQYHVGFYFSYGDSCRYGINSLGMKFTYTLPNTFLITSPTTDWNLSNDVFSDTSNWVLFQDTITATGDERFLTIGNFYTDAASHTETTYPSNTVPLAYYYLDNVFVIPLDTNETIPEIDVLGPDKYLCSDDPFTFNLNPIASEALWEDTAQSLIYTVADTGMINVLTRIDGCVYTDSVSFLKNENCTSYVIFPNIFTPNGDGINDFFSPLVVSRLKSPTLTLMNRWGSIVYSTDDLSIPWDGTFNGNPCPDGNYYWFIEAKEKHPYFIIQFNDSGFFTLQR